MAENIKTQIGEGERICWKCGEHFGRDLEVCPHDGSRLLDLDASDLADPMIGTLFDGRFRIYRKLGEGGMGNVYSARQIDFERDVALKILKVDFLRDENIRKRFMYEARAISNLRHPNALRLFDFGQAPDGSFYMVMELLEGESLADRLAYRFVSFREVFNTVPPVCGVLFEAHQNRVIHRDLKPENIYLVDVNQGREEFAKLLDFGIAKHLTDRTMTQSGTLWGTPAYMSPEQAKGDPVDAPADIYAVGIILFELISGNLPFHAETQMGVAMKHINVSARPLRSIPGLADVVPPALDDLVMECLSKDPAERPKDCQEIAERLAGIKTEFFDDALLDCIPAEEVDAIALQDWIAEEPSVDESAIPVGLARPYQSVQTPPPTTDLVHEPHQRDGGTDELAAFRPARATPWPMIAASVVVILAILALAISSLQSDDAAPVPTQPDAVVVSAELSNEAAAGTAGAAASHAASIYVTARVVSDAILQDETLATDIATGEAPPAAAPAAPAKKRDLKAVKKVIERTF